MESNLKTLLFIKQKGKINIQKQLLAPITGFSRLRKKGLIEIYKQDGEFFACLTEKGEEFLITNIPFKIQEAIKKIQDLNFG